MPHFFFPIHDGKDIPDHEGIDCADRDEARSQAIRAAGEILRDQSQQASLGNRWQMLVVEESGRTVCTLTVTIESSQ